MDLFPSNSIVGDLILLFVVFMLAFGIGGLAGFALIYAVLTALARRNRSWTRNKKVALSLAGAFCGALAQWAGWYSGLWYHWFIG